MFGIGGSELIFIILIAVMLFGADKIPEIARTLGKGMAQLKNATEDIKSEINKSAEANGIDIKSLSGGFSSEIDEVKHGFDKMIDNGVENITQNSNLDEIHTEISAAKDAISDIAEGPIKRQS